jgi:hypothetical protein
VFVDKAVMFDQGLERPLTSDSRYPVAIALECRVLKLTEDAVVISTQDPSGVESVEGVSKFEVKPDTIERFIDD